MNVIRYAAIFLGLPFVLFAGLSVSRDVGAKGVYAAVLVSADAEWSVVRSLYPRERYESSPFGQYFFRDIVLPDKTARHVVIFHGGWGKVAAAASTQYVIDRWDPGILVNLGTCGGLAGAVERFAVILAAKTVIYDIIERMGSPEAAVADYSTTIDLGWLKDGEPASVRRGVIVSADQDVDPASVPILMSKYGAVAADWESGAIAHTAVRNHRRILILRGVTDIVGPRGDETYGHSEIFQHSTGIVMKRLFADLPLWLARIPDR